MFGLEDSTEVDDIHEYFVPRTRIRSHQSTDSLDKWLESDKLVDGSGGEDMELTGKWG